MSRRQRLTLVVGWVVSLVAMGVWASAQAPTRPGTSPQVISGNDLGFRIDTQKGTTPVGKLVIRVNGQWVEPRFGGGVTPATTP